MEPTKLINFLRAGFSLFYLKTDEPERVKEVIYPQLENSKVNARILQWDCLAGDPGVALKLLAETEPEGDGRVVMFAYNYHWFLSQAKIVQTIQNFQPVWANEGKALVVVSSVEKIPPELKKSFTSVNLPLPHDDEIREAMTFVAPDDSFVPKGQKQSDIVRVSKGLTKRELENVYALSIIEQGGFDYHVVNNYRSQIVKQSGLADILSTDKTFKTVIGYQVIKDSVMETILDPEAQGIVAIGPTGTGKTSLMQAIANECGKLPVKVRTGALYSKFVGETDQNIEALVEMLNALGDCFVLFDEFEKQFSGVGAADDGTGGTTVRAGGRFLEWFEDTPAGIYRAATCNSMRGIPPEYFRPGRWDSGPWYVDLPSDAVKKEILKHYIKVNELTKKQTAKVPKMPLWTGAEIEALCKTARMRKMSLTQAAEFVLPMAEVAKEQIQEMRDWSKGRTIQAEKITEKLTTNRKPRKLNR